MDSGRRNDPREITPASNAYPETGAPRGGYCPATESLYAPDLYPASNDGRKVKIFGIEDASFDAAPDISQTRFSGGLSAKTVAEAVSDIARTHQSRAFLVLNRRSPRGCAEALAQELLTRGAGVLYARWGAIPADSPAAMPLLRASGCLCLGFEVDSGSQWMLDRCHRRSFTVTQAEQTMRAAKATGLFVAAHLDYPAPLDDRHTYSETVRLIERTRPHSVQVRCDGGKPARARFEQARLLEAAADLGVPAAPAADIALSARLAGYEGREHEFAVLAQQLFMSGDAEGIARLTEQINAGARGAANVAFDHALAAVGN